MPDERFNVEQIIVPGEFDHPKDSAEIIDQAASMLDQCETHEIFGPNLFLGEDGRFYTVTVEANIGEASFGFTLDRIGELLDAVGPGTPEHERPAGLKMQVIRAACEYLRRYCDPEEDAALAYNLSNDAKDAIDAIVPDWDTGQYEGWTIADLIALPDVQPELYRS